MDDHRLTMGATVTNTNPVGRAGGLVRNGTPSNSHVRRILRGTALSAALLLIAIPAALSAPQRDRVARERHACAVVLRLQPSVAGYDACIRSLDRSLMRARSASLTANEAAACADVGLGPAGQSLDQCAADLRAALSDEETRDPGD